MEDILGRYITLVLRGVPDGDERLVALLERLTPIGVAKLSSRLDGAVWAAERKAELARSAGGWLRGSKYQPVMRKRKVKAA